MKTCLALLLFASTVLAQPRAPEGAEVVAIGAYIRAHLQPIDECYGQRLNSNAHLRGKLVLRFDIEVEGEVVNASADGMGDKPLVECVIGQVKAWHFDRPAAALRVAYPVIFQPN